MKNHIICVHENLKNHKCDICNKAFSIVKELNRHIKIAHKGQLQYHKCLNPPMITTLLPLGEVSKLQMEHTISLPLSNEFIKSEIKEESNETSQM